MMQSTSKSIIIEHLSFLTEKGELALERTAEIISPDDFLCSPAGMDLFDATTMRLQIVGEF
ncbi:hypothetical protein [Parabacteroides johnsonii]|uniref:hypothetical protein n=1 Tax=Parabacteroides johnsonii TaxID=387661 RepID=UPI0021CB2F33|nr:hypothetical protein [Parabacteroides johnsonii]